MSKWKYKFKTTPDVCQYEALKKALKKGKFGVFFEQRIGKSKVAIDFCGVKHVSEGITKVLIVSPLSVRATWEEQIETHLPTDIGRIVWMYPYGGDAIKAMYKVFKATDTPHSIDFLVINYDRISTEADRLIRWKPDVVIFDEAHLLSNHSSKRSRAAYRIARVSKYRLGLTGTPIPKHFWALFGIFRTIDDKVYGDSWREFRDEYCIMGGYMGKQVTGCKNPDRLSALMSDHSIRVLRKDVLKEPEVENVIVPVELEKKARTIYTTMRDSSLVELETGVAIAEMAGTRVMRLQQICGGFLKNTEGCISQVSTAKLDATMDLINTIVEADEKAVVFCRFIPELSSLAHGLTNKGIGYDLIYGERTEEERKQAIQNFQNDPKCHILLIQVSTGIMGICLDRAHINIFYSLDYSLSNYLQAKDRVMGRGQTHDVTNYFMACKYTVDYKIMKTLQNNQDVATAIADKWRWFIDDRIEAD